MASPEGKEYIIQLDDDVPDDMHRAFQSMVQHQQASLGRVHKEHKKTLDRLEQLEAENRALRAKNDELNNEAARLRSGLTGEPFRPMPRRNEETQESRFVFERKIMNHDAPVHSVTKSANHDIIATASWDGTVCLYNLNEDKKVLTLGDVPANQDNRNAGKMQGLYSVAFAKTADNILGCTSCDHSVYLWNYHNGGKLQAKLTGHKNEVNSIDFHSSQQVMATASDDCTVMVWDFQEGIVLRTLEKHTKAVYGCSFLGQENQYLLATCCFDSKTRVFDMRDKQVVALLSLHKDDVIGIDFSVPKQLLATGSDDGLIGIWDVRTWKLKKQIDTKEDVNIRDNEVKRVCFSPDGGLLSAACSSGGVLTYDINNMYENDAAPAKLYSNLGGHVDCVFDVTMGVCPRTNAKYLVSASHDHSCFYWRERN